MPERVENTKSVPLREQRKLLRTFRKQFGITLEKLGERAGLSKAMLSRFEAGNRDLSAEAWAGVLTAMGSLLAEDDAKRKSEWVKAEATAAKLGATLPGFLLGMAKSPEEIAGMQRDLDRSRASEKLHGLIAEAWGPVIKEREKTITKAELWQEHTALIEEHDRVVRKVQEQNDYFADLTAKDYVILPQSIEHERDELKKRVTELEEEIRALREKQKGDR